MSTTVEIDASRCTGHGRCYSVAPQVFEPDEQGAGVVRSREIPDELTEIALRGANACPERAVTVIPAPPTARTSSEEG